MGGKAFVPEIVEETRTEDALEMVERADLQRRCQSHTKVAVHALAEVASNMEREIEPDEDGYFPPKLRDDGSPTFLDYTGSARATAANKLLEHGHGRPSQGVRDIGDAGDCSILVVIHQLSDGTRKVIKHQRAEIDVTPTREQVGDGDKPAERVEAPELSA